MASRIKVSTGLDPYNTFKWFVQNVFILFFILYRTKYIVFAG